MPDCEENMALCSIMPKKFKRRAQPSAQPMNINGLASAVIRLD